MAIEAARMRATGGARSTRSIQCDASQSNPVVAMINRTKNGFHAA